MTQRDFRFLLPRMYILWSATYTTTNSSLLLVIWLRAARSATAKHVCISRKYTSKVSGRVHLADGTGGKGGGEKVDLASLT
jgi:hypothetical protein